MKSPSQDAERILIRDRAAEWVCELQEHEGARHEEFSAWVRQSPRHVEEFLLAATAWQALDDIGPEDPAEVESAIAAALNKEAASKVIRLQEHPATAAAVKPTVLERRPVRNLAIAAAVGTVIVCGSLTAWVVGTRADTYTTAVGEQRAVRLADGSVVHLNTQSRLRIDYSSKHRDIRLLAGEALFSVQQDAARPFRVIAGDSVIQALGTQFNVYRRNTGTRVSVVEGAVQVTAQARNRPAAARTIDDMQRTSSGSASRNEQIDKDSLKISAGEDARVTAYGITKHASGDDVAQAVAWRERLLIFRGETLTEITAEVNRYTPRRFIAEGDAGTRRFAGTFSADDPHALIRFLSRYDDLSIETLDDRVIIRQR